MSSEKKIKQLETLLEEAQRELTNARQENRRIGTTSKTYNQMVEDLRVNLEQERKQSKSLQVINNSTNLQ